MELADVTDSKSVGSNTVWVRVPPPAPNTEAPVGCLCVWLSRTGLEAGGTKRSCGAFCPAGERKQSGRAARSASKGRFERRVPPPAPRLRRAPRLNTSSPNVPRPPCSRGISRPAAPEKERSLSRQLPTKRARPLGRGWRRSPFRREYPPERNRTAPS